ncbi:hypothetical protein [Natrialba magadii]|nr:hypothetical protein [Natrialba magadii]
MQPPRHRREQLDGVAQIDGVLEYGHPDSSDASVRVQTHSQERGKRLVVE